MRIKSRRIIGLLLAMVLMMGVMAPAAFATDTTEVQFQLQIGSDTPADLGLPVTPTADGNTYYYSSYNCQQDTYKAYKVYGQSLNSLIDTALTGSGYTRSNVDTVKFISNDSAGTNRTINLSTMDNGYYWYDTDEDADVIPDNECTPVIAVIATQCCSPITGTPSSSGCLRNFYGQPGTEYGYDDDTMGNWVKTLSTIVLHVN